MRAEAQGKPRTAPNSHRGTQPRKPTICPPFATQFQKYLSFCPVEVSENPEETPKHPKEFLIFVPFQPILPSFGAIEVLRSCRSCADAISQSGTEAHKERGNATRKRAGAACIAGAKKGTKERRRQAHKPTKKGVPPP